MTTESVKENKHIFKKAVALDMCHVKGITTGENLNTDYVKKYYSPSAIGLDLLVEAYETLKAFYGETLFDMGRAKILFPQRTSDPILVLFDIRIFDRTEYGDEKTVYDTEMVLAIAPRARFNDEKCDDFPKGEDLESTDIPPHPSAEAQK